MECVTLELKMREETKSKKLEASDCHAAEG